MISSLDLKHKKDIDNGVQDVWIHNQDEILGTGCCITACLHF